MKFLALIVSTFLILSLASQLEARRRFYCLWSTKRTCSKSTPTCIRLQTGVANNVATYTCKYYRSDCQYLLDSCKGETSEYLKTYIFLRAFRFINIDVTFEIGLKKILDYLLTFFPHFCICRFWPTWIIGGCANQLR